MKALVLQNPGSLEFVDAPLTGSPGEGEALVRVHRVGICGTDIHAFSGKQPFFTYPRILGHELGLEVIETGRGVSNVKPGDRCSLEPYVNCGRCIACRRGRGNCCTEMRVIGVHTDGGMRERFTVPARKLHPSATLTYDQLALVEPLGIGAHAVERAGLEAGEFALVIGAGPIGLATMQFALEKGARVIVLDIDASRLAFCTEQLGVSHAIHGEEENVAERLAAITGGDLPTAVFDATGSPRSMVDSFDYPAHGGRLVFVGLFQGDVTFRDPDFHKRELTLLASRNAHPADFTRIIRLIESGRIDTTPWITHRGSFDETPDLFPSWTRPGSGVIKSMIELQPNH